MEIDDEIMNGFCVLIDKINSFAYTGKAHGEAMNETQRLNFIVEKLTPTVEAWGFTREKLAHAIALAGLPKSFTIYSPRRAKVVTDASHRQEMRDRGETLQHVAVLDASTSSAAAMPKSSHLFVFVTQIDGVPSLRADWQMLPKLENATRQRRQQAMPKLPNIDPGGQGHTADVPANRLQRLLDRR